MTDPILAIRAAVALTAAATIVAAFARRTSLPDSVVLVLAGLLGATLFPEIALAVTPGLVLGVFVPGLVFAAAYSIDWTDLRPVLAPIVALAIPGVLASAVIVAFALHLAVGSSKAPVPPSSSDGLCAARPPRVRYGLRGG